MKSTITARVTLNGNPLLGETVAFSATPTLGTLSSDLATTSSQGYASVTFKPGLTVGNTAISASWGTLTQTATITVSSGAFSVSANPNIVAAGSTMTSLITARVTLNGAGVSGETVSFSLLPVLGSLSSATAVTDAQGYATVTFTPGVVAGVTTITASWGTVTQNANLVVE